ncbi:MAG TPA: MFS transporter [Phenylobacterium sp.]|nr:MFS transporter [Phenylobacterium sp.]
MADTTAGAAAPYPGQSTPGYRAYVLGALLVVYTFNFIDRVVVGIIQEPIKQEFALSDFQLGLLGGPAFAVLYTLLGIPIARIAEKRNRMTIIAICVGLWSLMTALCGLAVSYATLLTARIGVSIGEAGCTPPAQSVIADYFPLESRATAISIYALGIPIGSMLAAIGGGWLAQEMGWRSAFLTLGLPGLIVALVVKLTVREPERAASSDAAEAPGFGAALKVLMGKPTFWQVSLGSALASFTGYGVGQYLNSFMMRTHGLTLLQASQLSGVVLGIFAAIGTFLAGYLADRLVKRHPTALAWLPALGFAIAAPLFIAGYMAPNLWIGVPLLMAGSLTQYFYLGCMYASVQGIVQPRMRATATAVLLFIVNLLGYGLGPPLVGALSDALANWSLAQNGLTLAACAGEAAKTGACAAGISFGLKYAIVIGLLGYLWAAVHFLLAGRTLRRDWVG